MLSGANHVIFAASITIFTAGVTAGQRIGWQARSLPVDGAADGTGRLFARIDNARPALKGC
jgi:hypothetical protein